MLVKKNTTFRGIMAFTGHHLVWLTLWALIVVCLYEFSFMRGFTIPWLPLSVIGTAVAFYVGFKNNQSYDRLWEARKIWGSIINSSRSWGLMIRSLIVSESDEQPQNEEELKAIHKKLINRHIAWLYALRSQLLLSTEWEHVNLRGSFGRFARRSRKTIGVGLFNDEASEDNLKRYLQEDEYEKLINFKNTATQIIDKQAQDIAALRKKGCVSDLDHVELQEVLREFYNFQGMAERIKKFPLPRQYANMSFIFVCLFVFMLPFGVVTEFAKLGDWGSWFSIPFIVIIGWVYVVMELVGDYSENPFEGLYNDIPMLSICRVIEIDLLEMMGETDLPDSIEAKNGVLM